MPTDEERSAPPAHEVIEVRLARVEEQFAARVVLIDKLREADREAVRVALVSQKELLAAHNDLLNQMRERDREYVANDVYDERHTALGDRVTRIENLQAKLVGGLGVVAFIGVTNLIRVWFGA